MAGGLNVFTRTMAAGETITIESGAGISQVSVLCLTDNSGSNGVVITGVGSIKGTASNGITLTANQSATISVPEPQEIGSLTIVTGTSSTATVIAS